MLRLRQEVFGLEQDCLYQDLDGLDQRALHLWCRDGRRLLAYLRCLPPAQPGRASALGRIVIHPRARGLGMGGELVRRGIALSRGHWPGSPVGIAAQARLEEFYRRFGFAGVGPAYELDGIAHIDMILES